MNDLGIDFLGTTSGKQRSASLNEYLVTPTQKYLSGPTYIVWSNTYFSGISFWGRPLPEHMDCVIRALEIHIGKLPRAFLVDVRQVESINPAAFDVLSQFVRSRKNRLRYQLSGQALLYKDGFVGACAIGFYKVTHWKHPVKAFRDPFEALTWLGIPVQQKLISEIDGMVNAVKEPSGFLQSLRAHLLRNLGLGDATLEKMAAEMGVSSRCLQRRLFYENSSFIKEKNALQISTAKRLLTETDQAIKHIAVEVGCASASAFIILFYKFEHLSPTVYRNQFRSMTGKKLTR